MRTIAIWWLAALLSASPLFAPPAVAQASATIRIPKGTLEKALVSLARQTGASIGMPGRLPRVQVKAILGHLTVEQTLAMLLKGSGYRAIPISPNVWRLEAIPLPPKKPPAPPKATPNAKPPHPVRSPPQTTKTAPDPVEITVTAAKRMDALETTPIDSTVIDSISIGRFSVLPDTAAVASLDSGMAMTNVGPGRNRAFLRGVADSPFNGQTQSTVANLLDDARITFNAPDPDLRLIDVDRIELLKGPQGPLYGTGAIGGVYRIVTKKPNLDRVEVGLSASVTSLAHGGTGVAGSAMLNLPVKRDTLGLRLVAYGALEPGWIDNGRPDGANSNMSQLRGGRIALRWKPDPEWTVDLAGTVQLLHVDDSQYVTGLSTRRRSGILSEPHDNDFVNARLSIAGKWGDVDIFSSTSWTVHEVDSVLDATPAAASLGQTGPTLFDDDRLYHVFNQEMRASSPAGKLQWMVGGSLLSAKTRVETKLGPATGPLVNTARLDEEATELALFGSLSFNLSDIWTVDAGARLFSTDIRDDRLAAAGAAMLRTSRKGISPSLAISLKPNGSSYYFLRMASAFRPAGLGIAATAADAEFDSDELNTLELGGRWHSDDRHLSGHAVLYASRWTNIQSDYLLPSGLIATRNSGRAQIIGAEASGTARVGKGWSVSAGGTMQHSRLEKVAPGVLLAADRQLPVIPAYRLNLGLLKALSIADWHGEASLRAIVYGPSRLSLDPGLDRRIGGHSIMDFALTARRDRWTLGLVINNILDSDGDTFAFGNPFSVRLDPQNVPLRPRSIVVQVGWTLP